MLIYKRTYGRFNVSRAAMFGLDARIALAILVGLSAISGAVLQKTMLSVRGETYRQWFENIDKAHTQYYLDTGQKLPGGIGLGDLLRNDAGVANWKGPYLDPTFHTWATSDSISLGKSKYRGGYGINISSVLRKSSDWDATWSYCVSGDKDCAAYYQINLASGVDATNDPARIRILADLFNYLDQDGKERTGKVRANPDLSVYTTRDLDILYYKGLEYSEY